MNNATIRKQLGGFPTGPYRLAEQQSSIRHVETELSPEDHEEGVWVAVQDSRAFREREQSVMKAGGWQGADNSPECAGNSTISLLP
jgi:hypothetical protein